MLNPKAVAVSKTALPIKLDRQGWPKFTQSLQDIRIPEDGLVGVDLEYHKITKIPYMASIATTLPHIFSGPFEKVEYALRQFYMLKDVRLVGHNILSADCDVLERRWRIGKTPAGGVIDTLLAHYAMNQHLCHGNLEKSEDPDEVEWQRGPGKLKLGSMASQYLEWAEYKTCRGSGCAGPCPIHKELWYNALDAYAPILCWKEMLKEASELRSLSWPNGMPLERIHDHLVNLQIALNETTERGICIDLDFVHTFEAKLDKAKLAVFPYTLDAFGKSGKRIKTPKKIYGVGFNPGSQKEVKEWAAQYKIKLLNYSPDALKEALENYEKRKAGERTGTYEYVKGTLEKLIEYKKLGRGVKNWFGEDYIKLHPNGYAIKPEWKAYGGSMGRPVSSGPNVQNIPKHNYLAEVRGAFKAPKGFKWLTADAQQGEFRMIGFIGGVDPMDMGEDAFMWLVENTDNVFYEVAASTANSFLKKPRNGAKQLVHALDYGEGLRLIPAGDLTSRLANEESAGALVIYRDWIFANKFFVGFDGSNLAKRWYGSSSWQNRRKALGAQMKLMRTFPAIRQAQQRIMESASKGYVLTPSGHLLKLYGDSRDNIKKALAMNGQCTLSVYMQESFIEYAKRPYPPIMYIHDELGFLVPENWGRFKCLNYVEDMAHKSKMIDGFQCPIEASWGPTYGNLEKIPLD